MEVNFGALKKDSEPTPSVYKMNKIAKLVIMAKKILTMNNLTPR